MMRPVSRMLVPGLLTAVLAMVMVLMPWGQVLEEEFGLSLLFKLRGPRDPPVGVAVVAIDRDAAQALGQTAQVANWPRTLHARLIDALAGAGACAIAFDISFGTAARQPDDDRTLAVAMKHAGNVVLLDFLDQVYPVGSGHHMERRLPPIDSLANAAAAHGPFPLNKTGSVRAYWTFKRDAGELATLPVLAAQVHERKCHASPIAPRLASTEDGARLLDFYGPARSLPTIGFHEVLEATGRGESGAEWLRDNFSGHTVFVGFLPSRPSEQDRVRDDYPTVFTRDDGLTLSGVEIAATAFANLLEHRMLRMLPRSVQLRWVAVWGLLIGGLFTVLHGVRLLAVAALLSLGYLAVVYGRFVTDAQMLPLATPLMVQLPLALFLGVLWNAMTERRKRRWLGGLVNDLLPPQVLERLAKTMHAAGSQEDQLFGVFIMTDIQGFTSIAETLSPANATRMLNDYFALTFPPVERNGGSVSQINGDGMLAFWLQSAPGAEPCQAACLAALEIASLTGHSEAIADWPPLPTRIGVHAGAISLAKLGASLHHEYRAVGDAANTASRIEALSKHLGTKLLASDAVLSGVEGMLTRPVGEFVLSGRRAPVTIHELICRAADATAAQQRLCAQFTQALAAYRSRQWDVAMDRLAEILQHWPSDGPSLFYLQQARQFAADPPPTGWDAVVHMQSK